MTDPIRMINLGPMRWLRSHSVYQSTAQLLDDERPDSIVMVTPLHTHLAVGAGRNPAEVVNVDACIELNIPAITSPLSRPLTYYDKLMLVSQWVFHDQPIEGLVADFLSGTIKGLERLGLSNLQQTDDSVFVEDRLLLKTQTGQIGDAVIVQGEIFLRTQNQLIERLLGEQPYTTIWKEAPRPISLEMLHDVWIKGFQSALGREIKRGTPKQAETRISKKIDLALLKEAGDLLGREIVVDDSN